MHKQEEDLTDQECISVDISGGVVSPGIVDICSPARIIDIVEASGGFSEDVDTFAVSQRINLSKKVVDGEKIIIPKLNQDTQNNSITVNTISINTSSLTELQTLKGIGEVRASEIISNRPYTSIDELIEKHVLPQSIVDQIREQIRI